MLIKKVESNPQGKSLMRDIFDAFDPELELLQKQSVRRDTHDSELPNTLDKVENANETVYGKFAASDLSSSFFSGLLPNVRCSP